MLLIHMGDSDQRPGQVHLLLKIVWPTDSTLSLPWASYQLYEKTIVSASYGFHLGQI